MDAGHEDLSIMKSEENMEAKLEENMQTKPEENMVPRSKLLILEVNGLLCDIVRPIPKDAQESYIVIGKSAVIMRPYYSDFLKYCFNHFQVAVWSSKKRRNIQPIVEYILGEEYMKQLVFFWDQSKCTKTRYTSPQNAEKPVLYKELRKVWEKNPKLEDPKLALKQGVFIPWRHGDYTHENTLLVEKYPHVGYPNPRTSCIFPIPFSYKDKDDEQLGEVGPLKKFIFELSGCINVQKFIEDHPIGQEAIGLGTPSWIPKKRKRDTVAL